MRVHTLILTHTLTLTPAQGDSPGTDSEVTMNRIQKAITLHRHCANTIIEIAS